LFLALAAAALGSVKASPAIWASALLLVLVTSRTLPLRSSVPITELSVAALSFAAWLVATNGLVNPSYTAAAPYHAAFLAAGILLGRRAGLHQARTIFRAALALAVFLSLWAIWQRASGEPRGHALFETPATLASTINLAFAPALVLMLVAKPSRLLLMLAAILAGGLLATASRGGWVALGISGVVAAVLLRRSGHVARPVILAVAVLGAVLGAAAILASVGSQSSLARVALYELSIKSAAASSLLIGDGYLSFYYRVEANRSSIPTYDDGTTYFVHNDYLQAALELGIPGAIGLLALAILPLGRVWRALPGLTAKPEQRYYAIAIAVALGSVAAHALVDFPFYVPVCLLLYGTGLGMLEAIVSQHASATPQVTRIRQIAVAGAAAVMLWALSAPLAAEAAAAYAHRKWRAGDTEGAATWFEAARRVEPRDWRYHWYAGQFWYFFAVENKIAQAAQFADRAFAAGFAANPREPRNLLGRIVVHRNLRALLASPADGPTVIAWAENAVALAPLNPAARAERDVVARQFGPPSSERP
jgi:O-antigen ligase